MKIQIEYIDCKKSAKVNRLIKKVLKEADKMYCSDNKCSVCVSVCNDEYIKGINAEHRKIDKSTDVLSFPMINWNSPCEWSKLKMGVDIDPETKIVELGDIIISIETAKVQAIEYGHSIEREISYLALHGFLHLLGYDHMTDDEKSVMRKKEESVLKSLKIERK
ncbi:MAG: rRNA maturation RNase YbeY [Eubacteriales bacterium]